MILVCTLSRRTVDRKPVPIAMYAFLAMNQQRLLVFETSISETSFQFWGRPVKTSQSNPQTLLIDADDTLWENNIYFEQATEGFIDYLDHSTLDREQVRAAIDEIEIANAAVHGYGSRSFAKNLIHCYQHLAEREIGEEDLATILGFGEMILAQEIRLIDGVEETLEQLASRHRLIMFTKGHEEEQQMKIDRSGIDTHFFEAVIVAEKNEQAYRAVSERLAFDPGMSWMVGNSPKSDINPARRAGMGAVFIPHDMTWRLEHQEIEQAEPPLLVLERFRQLVEYF